MVKPRSSELLRQELIDKIMASALNHIEQWIATLGSVGSMRNKHVQPTARVAAAKTGIDLVTKLITMGGASVAGEELLKQLGELEFAGAAAEADEEDDSATPDAD